MYGALARGFHLDLSVAQILLLAVIVLPPTLTGALLARVALPNAFRLRREPGGVAA